MFGGLLPHKGLDCGWLSLLHTDGVVRWVAGAQTKHDVISFLVGWILSMEHYVPELGTLTYSCMNSITHAKKRDLLPLYANQTLIATGRLCMCFSPFGHLVKSRDQKHTSASGARRPSSSVRFNFPCFRANSCPKANLSFDLKV